MRVLYLNPFSQEVSGPDESLRTLLRALIPRGVEAHVVLPSAGPQVPRYEQIGARVHVAPLAPLQRGLSLSVAAYPLRLLRAARAVAALARRLDANLIHTNMEVLLEGALAARWLSLPHVLHYRGNTLDRPKLVFDALTAAWYGGADAVYCISNATAEVFRRRGYDSKVETLYNPIDLAAFDSAQRTAEMRDRLGARAEDALVGTVARIHPRKDLETFLRAAAQVAEEARHVHFAIVGAAEADVERAYRVTLDSLVRSLGLESRVTFTGAIRDIPAVMRALDVFVLTSRHEGFGRVLAEAMAAHCAAVATDEGALPELVKGGEAGRLAAPADPTAFARHVSELIEDPQLAAQLGARAAAAARQFDVEVIAQRVWERYQALVARRSQA